MHKVIERDDSKLIGIDDIRDQCRIDYDCDDNLLYGYLSAAVDFAQNHTRRIIGSQKLEKIFDSLDGNLSLEYPLTSVESVVYIDTEGTEQTLGASNYYVDSMATPGKIEPAYGVTWPQARQQTNAVTVSFTAGNFPYSVRQAILLLIGHWYENREASITGQPSNAVQFAVEQLLYPHRVYSL